MGTTLKPAETTQPEKPCPIRSVIRDDHTVRPKKSQDLCAIGRANSRGQVRAFTKIIWGDCSTALVNEFSYNVTTKQISAIKPASITKSKGREMCWTLHKKQLRANSGKASGLLKLKPCKVNGDLRQMFDLRDGRIWLDLVLDNGKMYCATFEGEGDVI